jgi:transposase
MHMQPTVGIDISKDTLDAYRLTDGQRIQASNDKSGHQALIKWLGREEVALVIFEATGAYHVLLEKALSFKGIAYKKVNPKQARRFAEATGRIAKTDRVDSAMLARMGAVLELEKDEPKSENLHDLRELMTARRALMKDKVASKTRLQNTTHSLLKSQINDRLKQIDVQIQQLDKAIGVMIADDQMLSRKLAILISIPGIAKITAYSMIIEMPELGTLEGKEAASLAGLAPFSRQSGKWQGKERIKGGRGTFRRAIYMPALVASRCNPALKAKYDELVRAGKPAKLALTVIMRKLVVLANALLRDDRKWAASKT